MLADPGVERGTLAMAGLEPDNLLALLALLGLLRALETSQPEWKPRAFWKGSPWIAQLSLAVRADQAQIAHAANSGVALLAASFDVDMRKNVDFGPEDYRIYAERVRSKPVSAALASALTSECRFDKDRLPAAPLVMLFGQGHQCFLERLRTNTNDQRVSEKKLIEALFHPWQREDEVEGFRWDPEEDQRYAFRFGNPSKAGAALTVAGANRLAAIGFLSFPTVARERRIRAAGAIYNGRWSFVWPIWTNPLSRGCIEAFLNHPDVLKGQLTKVRSFGVAQIFQAQRVANGKYLNVTRARPFEA